MEGQDTADISLLPDDSPGSVNSDVKQRLKMKVVSRQSVSGPDAVSAHVHSPLACSDIPVESPSHVSPEVFSGASSHHGDEDKLLETAQLIKRPLEGLASGSSPPGTVQARGPVPSDVRLPSKCEGRSPRRDPPQRCGVSKEEEEDDYQVDVYFEDGAESKQDGVAEPHTVQQTPDAGWVVDQDAVSRELKTEPDTEGSVAVNTPQPPQADIGRGHRHVLRGRGKRSMPGLAGLSSVPFKVVPNREALSSLVQSCVSTGSTLPPMLCPLPVSAADGSSASLSLMCTVGQDHAEPPSSLLNSTASSDHGVSSMPQASVGPKGVFSPSLHTADAFALPQTFVGSTSSFPVLSQIVAERLARLLSSAPESGVSNTPTVVTSSNASQLRGAGDTVATPLSAAGVEGSSGGPHVPQMFGNSSASVPQTVVNTFGTSASSLASDNTSAPSTDVCTSSSSTVPLTSVGAVPSSQPHTSANNTATVPCPSQLVLYHVTPMLVLPQAVFDDLVSSSLPVEDRRETGRASKGRTRATPAKLSCDKCSQTFQTYKALQKHMQSHVHRPHKCEECGKSFAGAWHLRKHRLTHAKAAKTFDCSVCQKSFASQVELDEHVQGHADEKPFVCEVCNKGFYSSGLLNKHKKQHASSKHVCNVCNETFKSGAGLKEHKKTHAPPSRPTPKEVLCELCGKKFASARAMCNHVCKEKKKQGLQSRSCGTCGKTFPSRVCLQIHIHSAHMDSAECLNLDRNFFSEHKDGAQPMKKPKKAAEPNPERFVCPVCGKVLKNLTTLHVHERVHKRPFSCKTCNKGFSHYYKLKRHQHVHTGIKDFTCEVCEKKFISSQTLKLHYTGIHLGNKPFACEVCDQGFVTRHTLKLHMLKHSDKKPFTCEVCGRAFKYECVLKNHRLLHFGEKPFKCDICDKAYVCSNYLTKHKRRAHSDPKYTCDVCGKTCYFANELKNHKLIHSDEKPFTCEVCSKSFHTLIRLKNHKRIHSDEKPFSCHLCDKVYSSAGVLNSHNRRVHSGKSFTCEVCSKTFKHCDSLKDHMNVHLQLKNFVCEECGKDFYSSNSLNTHKRLKHMDIEKQFVCNVCGKSFPFQSYLREHEKTHTKEKTLVCELCNKAVKYKLSRHMKRVHNYVKP
ncbi:uncharacterized protein LOC143277880 [Babylonia areolata]|uniref:uncharacterized protein LOC143277880 n=1 Tax=Babylonia areolata TaxID=304850 RepID=UPI003FD37CD2